MEWLQWKQLFVHFCDECEDACHSTKYLKKNNALNHEDHNHQFIICEKHFMYNQDLDAHVEKIHHVSSKENYLNLLMS